jgi:hypothetical protein
LEAKETSVAAALAEASAEVVVEASAVAEVVVDTDLTRIKTNFWFC